VQATPAGTPVANATTHFCVGSTQLAAATKGTQDIAFAQIHNVGLTSAEIASIVTDTRAYLTGNFSTTFAGI
jgi:hypothetical protein